MMVVKVDDLDERIEQGAKMSDLDNYDKLLTKSKKLR